MDGSFEGRATSPPRRGSALWGWLTRRVFGGVTAPGSNSCATTVGQTRSACCSRTFVGSVTMSTRWLRRRRISASWRPRSSRAWVSVALSCHATGTRWPRSIPTASPRGSWTSWAHNGRSPRTWSWLQTS